MSPMSKYIYLNMHEIGNIPLYHTHTTFSASVNLVQIIRGERRRNMMSWTTVTKASFGPLMTILLREQRAQNMSRSLTMNDLLLNLLSLYLPLENSAGDVQICFVLYVIDF